MPHQPGLVVQRLEHRHRGHGGAVRVGDDALRPLAAASRPELTSLTTSGTSGSLRHAEELSITIAPASANRGACTRDIVAPAENSAMSRPAGSAVAASSTTISCPRNGSFLPAERAEAKNRTLVDREVAFRQQRPHHLADLPGRADYADAQPMLTSRSRVDHGFLVAAQIERLVQRPTALSSSVSLTSTEIRISEVEMMSMLTPASASASQNVAVTPGCERIPAPISDTLPMWSS